MELITVQSFKFYHAFLHQDFKILKDFLNMKFADIYDKLDKIEVFFVRIGSEHEDYEKLWTIYQNLFIETEYLSKLVQRNKSIF